MRKLPGETLIVIPALNEESTIKQVIAEIASAVPLATCLVVNDGSTDRTSAVAAEAGAIVASLPYNLGVGGAMRLGFNYAKQNGYSFVVQVDADGQHDPSEISKLLEPLQRVDLVLGSRFAGIGNYEVAGPRKWAMVALAKILSKTSKTTLTDTTSGFRASGPRAIQLFSEHYPAEYLGDTVESLVIAARAGLSIEEIPVVMRARAGGVPSHNPAKSALFLLRVGLAVTFAYLRPSVQFDFRGNKS